MSNLRLVETVDNIIYGVGNKFTLKTTILWNDKIKDSGYKLDPITDRQYESGRYNEGGNKVTKLQFRANAYLVFEYKDFDVKIDGKPLQESVYISYPNMDFLLRFINDCMDLLYTEGLYTKDGIHPDYKDVVIQSEKLAGGKRLALYPTKITKKDFVVDGVCLLIANNDCFVEMDLSAFTGLCYIINNYNLLSSKDTTINMAMQYMNGKNVPAEVSHSSGNTGFNSNNRPSRSIPGGGLSSSNNSNNGNRGGFMNRRSVADLNGSNRNTGLGNRTTQSQPVQSQEPEIQDAPQEEQGFTPANNTANNQANTSGNKSKLFSLENIESAAETIDPNGNFTGGNADFDDEIDF